VRQAAAFFPVGVFLSLSLLFVFLSAVRQPVAGAWRLLITGLVAGTATAYRTNFLVFVPILLAWLVAHSQRSLERTLRATALFSLGVMLALAPFTLRNWVVSGRVVILTEAQFEANLRLGGLVPLDYGGDIRGGGPSAEIGRMVRFWREQPRHGLELLTDKLTYVVGLRPGGSPVWWWLGSLAMGLVGLVLVLALGAGGARGTTLLLSAFVLAQLGVLVVMRADHQRLYLPMLPLLWILFIAGATALYACVSAGRLGAKAEVPIERDEGAR
jgi:hypothetical protein